MSALTFHHALEQAELLARQSLPTALHERLSCSVALVKDGKVLQLDDGHTWEVESSSKPEVHYRASIMAPATPLLLLCDAKAPNY